VLRSVPRPLAHLLLAGSALFLVGHAAAQSPAQQPAPAAAGNQSPQPAPAAGGLLLPGAVKPTTGSPAAAGTIQQRPAAPPAAAAGPAPRPASGAAAGNAGQPAAGGKAAAGPAQPGKVGSPTGPWEASPEVFSDSTFRHCATLNRYDNNLALGFIQGPQKKINMIIGVPGGRLPQGAQFEVKVKVDGKAEKKVPALVINPEVVGVDIVRDETIIAAIRNGNVLSVEVPNDQLAFQLKGTTKALADLGVCVDQAMAGKLQMPAPPPAMPASLAKLLVDSGLKEARALPVDKMPPQSRRGDFEWMIGDNIRGHVRRIPVGPDGGELEKISTDYLEALKGGCTGTMTPALGAIEKIQSTFLRSGNLTCDAADGKIHVAITLQLLTPPAEAVAQAKQQGQDLPRILNVFSHETIDANKAKADEANAGLLRELKKLAAAPPPQRPAQPGAANAPTVQGQPPRQ
jgi:hypothetical protein